MKIDPAHLKGVRCFRTKYWPDGGLRVLELYKAGQCLAILELSRNDPRGRIRIGPAGEIYKEGTIEPIGPFAGDKPGKTGLSFEAWTLLQIKKLRKLAY